MYIGNTNENIYDFSLEDDCGGITRDEAKNKAYEPFMLDEGQFSIVGVAVGLIKNS